jgi:hypothetical protein
VWQGGGLENGKSDKWVKYSPPSTLLNGTALRFFFKRHFSTFRGYKGDATMGTY